MRDYKVFASLADLHIAIKHITAAAMKKQLKEQCIDVLSKLAVLDGIFICGDILHTIVSLNSDYSELYFWFIDQIYKIAKKKHAVVIIIRGTMAHDNSQLLNIKQYVQNDDGVDFRIYETIEETTIWGDYKVLLLPDVKITKDSEIEKYLQHKKKYDLILGHGLISTMKFFTQDSEYMPTKTYTYDPDKLIDACKGPVLFGHIHQYQTIRNHFYYIGPFTLLERGGIDSGYIIGGIYDKDRTKFKVEHYINTAAAEYIELDINADVLKMFPIDEITDAIDDRLNGTKPNDLITIRITRDDDIGSSDKVYMLENRYRKDKRISIKKKVVNHAAEVAEEENKSRKEKYSYIMDQNLDLADIYYRYYQDDILPQIADKTSPAARISLDEFRQVLKTT